MSAPTVTAISGSRNHAVPRLLLTVTSLGWSKLSRHERQANFDTCTSNSIIWNSRPKPAFAAAFRSRWCECQGTGSANSAATSRQAPRSCIAGPVVLALTSASSHEANRHEVSVMLQEKGVAQTNAQTMQKALIRRSCCCHSSGTSRHHVSLTPRTFPEGKSCCREASRAVGKDVHECLYTYTYIYIYIYLHIHSYANI